MICCELEYCRKLSTPAVLICISCCRNSLSDVNLDVWISPIRFTLLHVCCSDLHCASHSTTIGGSQNNPRVTALYQLVKSPRVQQQDPLTSHSSALALLPAHAFDHLCVRRVGQVVCTQVFAPWPTVSIWRTSLVPLATHYAERARPAFELPFWLCAFVHGTP